MNKKEQYRKLWKQRIEDFRQSDLTIKAWCKANEVKEHQFYYWRKKFNEKQSSATSLVPIDFGKIMSSVKQQGSIKIHIGSIYLEVEPEFNPSLLKDIMKVLMEVC